MNTVRRTAVLLGVTAAVVIGSSIPASATFSAKTVAQPATMKTDAVVAPTGLVVNDSCTTITTTVKQTVYTDPTTGARATTSSSSVTTRASSTSNVQGTTTDTVAGPGLNETTTTTVTKNTELNVSVSWAASTSRGVTGYVVSAHLGINQTVNPLLATDSATTSVAQVQDADALGYQPSVLVTTRTSYGWTADSVRTPVLSC